MASHFSECNHTWRDEYLQRVCMGRIHAREPPGSSSPSEPSEGFERPWHEPAPSPQLVSYLIFFFFLSLSSRPCSRESFALYSNTSLNRQEAVPISVRCVYHLSPGILIYTAVKNLAPNIFHFEPQRSERLCQRFDSAPFPLPFGGCVRGRRTSEGNAPPQI